MSHFEGITLAFSHRDRVWRTRYSFSPTSYGYVDNLMLSTNGRHPSSSALSPLTSNSFWLHDSNEDRNNFYGFQYKMEVAFVSNYNPSSTKIFKSISAESNSTKWKGFVTTNNNPFTGENNEEYQVSSLPDFVRKEGISYATILSSTANSTANLSNAFTAADGIAFNIDVLQPVFANTFLQWDVDILQQHGQITAGSACWVVVPTANGLFYIKGDTLVGIEGNTPSISEGYAYVQSLNAQDQTVKIRMFITESAAENYPFEWMQGGGDNEIISDLVCIETPALTNGDFMRGQYMNVYLTNDSKKPVECLAFNINYEPTRLDHSLGQNL